MSLILQAAAKDGASLPLGQLLYLERTEQWDSPAQGLIADFLAQPPVTEIARLTVWDPDAGWEFDGYVDQQDFRCGGDGCTLRLSARSRGGALLDNEAMPQAFYGLRYSAMMSRFASPYGLGWQTPENPVLSRFSIAGGSRVWQVIRDYCLLAFGQAPAVREHILYPKGLPQTAARQPDRPLLSLECRRQPTRTVSAVLLRSKRGDYTARLRNFDDPIPQYPRLRYRVPGNEFTGQDLAQGHETILNSMRDYEVFTLELEGQSALRLGDMVELEAYSGRPLQVGQVRRIFSQEGHRTLLQLQNPRWMRGGS